MSASPPPLSIEAPLNISDDSPLGPLVDTPAPPLGAPSDTTAPAAPPARRRRLGLILGLSLGGFGLVLIAAVVTAGAIVSAQHTPQAAVTRFLDVLDKGRATEAVHQLVHVSGADHQLIDDETYASVHGRVTGYRILSTSTNKNTALVRARVTTGHTTWTQNFRLLAGKKFLLWDNWRVDGSSFPTISLDEQRPQSIGVTVNGTAITRGHEDGGLLALPGTYRFGIATDSTLVAADAHDVTITSFDGQKSVALQVHLTADGVAKAQAAVNAFLDGCTSQSVLAPTGNCGFFVEDEPDGDTISDILWNVTQRPVVSFGDWTDGGWQVNTDKGGIFEMDGHYSGPDGRGDVAALFTSYDIKGYITFRSGQLQFVSSYEEGAGGEAGSGA